MGRMNQWLGPPQVWLLLNCEDFGSHWKNVDYAEALAGQIRW
jgi:hypothetical protein